MNKECQTYGSDQVTLCDMMKINQHNLLTLGFCGKHGLNEKIILFGKYLFNTFLRPFHENTKFKTFLMALFL